MGDGAHPPRTVGSALRNCSGLRGISSSLDTAPYTVDGRRSRAPVSRARKLVWSGMTGNATGPHVHFEIRLGGVNGNHTDPYPHCDRQAADVGSNAETDVTGATGIATNSTLGTSTTPLLLHHEPQS